MSEMIERVAKALCREAGDAPAAWPEYSGDARAAIEAMRKPTEAMKSSVYDRDFDIFWAYRADGSPGGPSDVWQAMIDEALK